MKRSFQRAFFRGAIASTALALGAATIGVMPPAASAAEADQIVLNIMDINDFHGRIDANTVKFAGTIEQLRAQDGAGGSNSLFISSGDNIGASLFASASQQDIPTIDVLNALELKTSAVGNHEFDQGYADLAGRVSDASDFSYLGANVYEKGTTTPALDEYDVFNVGDVRVAVIGAITEETPALVTPTGIATLDFGDPVEAVNRVAAEIEAGDLADVTLAAFHEGAGSGAPDGSTLEEEIAQAGAFADIVTQTDASVDAIFNGHTHKQYAWEGPVAGLVGDTRPVIQTGSYGANIGHVTLTYDTAEDDVVAHTVENVARTTTDDATLVSTYPRVAEVQTIVDAALDEAKAIGSIPVAEVAADITTAYTDSNGDGVLDARDDRSRESTLGNLVANALRDSVAEQPAGADIGVVNPGGLRSDLLYAGSTGDDADVNKDGVITYAEANAVLPFTNNLYSVSMTGAQFKTVLEQQWQRTASGAIPSRNYLQLGLSDNARYTFDSGAPEGERIVDVIVDGEPIDEDATYKIATFSFLATGGDNFHEFKNAQSVDTGLVDREAWIEYLGNETPVSPSFARRAVEVNDLPASVTRGSTLSFTLSQLDLTSLGSPANTTVSAFTLTSSAGESTELQGEAVVTNGAAPVGVVIPSNIAPGRYTLTGTATPSGTSFSVPVEVQMAQSQIVASQAPPMRVRANKTKAKIQVEVTATGFTPSGKVTVFFDGSAVGEASLKKGSATIKLDKFKTTGTKELSVVYAGNDFVSSSTTTLSIQVVK